MLTASELAGRAGCSEGRIRQLVEAGYLAPGPGGFPVGDVQRVRLADAFEEAGIPVEDIVRGIEAGMLDYSSLDVLLTEPAPITGMTYAELATEHERDFAFLSRLMGALALPRPEPEGLVRAGEASVLSLLLLRWEGATDDEVIRFARIYGEGLRRISDAATSLFHSAITRRVVEERLPAEEAAARVGEAALQVLEAAERLIVWLHRHHVESDIFRRSVEGTEDGLAAAGVRSPGERLPAIAFLDLTGYTALTEARGDEAAAELASRLAEIVDAAAASHGGRPVKWLGDGVMFHFPEPLGAVRAALELVERTPALDLPPSRVGVGAGTVIYRDGDYYGRTVNVAARIADYARPGEVLVTEETRLSAFGEEVEFDGLHPVALKGVSEPVPLYRARRV